MAAKLRAARPRCDCANHDVFSLPFHEVLPCQLAVVIDIEHCGGAFVCEVRSRGGESARKPWTPARGSHGYRDRSRVQYAGRGGTNSNAGPSARGAPSKSALRSSGDRSSYDAPLAAIVVDVTGVSHCASNKRRGGMLVSSEERGARERAVRAAGNDEMRCLRPIARCAPLCVWTYGARGSRACGQVKW